jgi:hypothetical protein
MLHLLLYDRQRDFTTNGVQLIGRCGADPSCPTPPAAEDDLAGPRQRVDERGIPVVEAPANVL